MVNKSPSKINFHGIPNYYWSEAPLENDYFVGLADKITDTKTGKLAGDYQNLTSQEYLDRLIPDLTRAAEEGFDQRYWYENSYNTINA